MMRMESLNVSAQSGTDQAAQQPTPTVPSVPTGLPPRSSAQSPNGKARFAAAANAIRFSNALLKKRQAPARPLQRYPSLGQLPVTRGASVTLSKNDSLDGPMAGTSFEHPEAAQGRWENVLMQYGGMTALAASYCAALMVGARIPAPSATAEKFLTHDLMKSIGIEKPGDRARVLLAIRRMPPVVEAEAADEDESVAEMFRTSRAAGKAKALGRVSKTYSSDRSHVQCMSTNRGDQFGATWFDLVGNDSTEKTDDQNGHQYGAALQSLINSFARTARGLRPTLDPLEAVPPPGTAADDVPMLTVENSIGEVKKNSTQAKYVTPPTTSLSQQTEGSGASHGFREVDNVWDPLVQAGNYSAATVAVERDAPHRVAFSFRVCRSLSEVEGCEADAICCRWHVVVDTQQRRIASVHEIDSVALATLRDHEALEGEVFNLADAFAAIVSAVLIETELVLDECSELLDECETKILLYDQHTLLIHSLFQLERRSAVYVRVIDVNQSVVADASRACALTRDFASLEAVWNRLRSKATNISTRSRRQLSLVLDLSGHRTNNLMSALTKPSVIFIPITFVTGVYGMRFENMPELHYENSYFVLWGLFLAAAVIGLFVTWRL